MIVVVTVRSLVSTSLLQVNEEEGILMRKLYILIFTIICMIVLQMTGCRYISTAPKEPTFDSATILGSAGAKEGGLHMHEKMAELRKSHADHLLYDTFECLAWEEQDTYVVVISSDTQIVNCSLVFSENGQLLNQTGLSAISVNDVSGLLHMAEENLVSKYGNFHFDSGSGRYLPSYITDCGCILVFSFEEGFVESISEYRFVDEETNFYGDVIPIVVKTGDGSPIND